MNDNIKTYGAYSPIKKAGNFYYVSGQVGVDSSTSTASSNVVEQVEQAIANLKRVLKTVDLGFEDIIKTTLYLVDIDDFSSVDVVYRNYFLDLRPARSTVAVKELPKVAKNPILFEIEAIAYKEEQ